MHVVILAGGIASGKSTVARELERRGALRIDLDALSREVTQAGSATNELLAQEFGADVLDSQTGELRRSTLAQRAFVSAERTAKLEAIVHPAIRDALLDRLRGQDAAGRHAAEGGTEAAPTVCVVEVPLLDRVEDLLPLADEVLCVLCPQEVRRVRAIGRGMRGEDFDARVARQPSEEYLASHATTILNNDNDEKALLAQIDDWWNGLRASGRGD